MKILKTVFISFLFLFLLGFILPKNSFASTFTVSGTVKDGLGASIQGATVTVNDANNDNTTTDSSGYYSLSVPQGTYTFQVTPPSSSNYSPATAPNYIVSGNSTLNFTLVSAGYSSMSGYIYNSTGEKLAGQTVYLRNYYNQTIASGTSDNNGFYTMQAQAGTYNIVVQANNNPYSLNAIQSYYFQVDNYSLTQSMVLNFTLPTRKVTVHVQDSSGQAVSGVKVSAFGNRFGVDLGNGLSVDASQTSISTGNDVPLTDQNGNTVVWLAPGGYTATLTPPSGSIYSNTSTGLSVTNDAIQQATLIIQSPVNLNGYIYNATGEKLAGQTVYLRNYYNQTIASGTSDSNGFYSMNAPVGTYNIVVQANNNPYSLNAIQSYYFQVTNYSLSQSTNLNFTLPTRKMTVHVQDVFGHAISGVKVSAFGNRFGVDLGNGLSVDASQTSISTGNDVPLTDQNGNTTLLLAPGGYTANLTPPSGSSYYSTTSGLSVTNDSTQQVTLIMQEPVTLKGYVYNSTGEATQGQSVQLRDSLGTLKGSATSGADGFYSIQAQAGTYNLILQGNNNSYSLNTIQTYYFQVDNYSLSQNTDLNFTIPTRKVTVHVQDSSGQAVSGVKVSAFGNRFGADLGNGLSVDSSHTDASTGNDVPLTDQNGNTVVWLAPGGYTATLTPPSGSIYSNLTIGLNVTSDMQQTDVIQLEFVHARPVTTISLSPNPDGNGTYQDPTTVTLSATAASGYTIANTYYAIDSGPQQTYTAPFTVTGGGNHTVTYWSVDNFGVPEAPNTKTFTILSTYTLSGTVYNDANQNGIQEGGEPGYPNATVTLNNGQTTTTDANGNYSFSGLAVGNYTETLTIPTGYTATTTNPTTVTISNNTTENFGIVENPPVTSINLSPAPYADGTYQDPTTVSLSVVATPGYNIANTYYTVDGGAQQTYSSPFQVTGNGNHIITYWSIDNNNVKEVSNSKLFTISEAYDISGTVYNDFNNNGIEDLTEPGFAGTTITLSTGQTAITDSNGNYAFHSIEAGNYTETVSIPSGYFATTTNPVNIDLTANTTINFGINHTPPMTIAALSPDSWTDGTYHDPSTITLSATTEPGFSIANTYYTVDGGIQQTYTTPFTVTGNGSHTITYWSVDNTGLAETPNTKSFTITEAYTLSGTVYVDANKNGVQDPGELGYQQITISLNTGQTTTTDSSGNYAFNNIEAGNYTETMALPTGFVTTMSNPVNIPLSTNTSQNFGIVPQAPSIGTININPNPIQTNNVVTATASFTEPITNPADTATWNWGDNSSSSGIVTEPTGSTPGSVSGSHSYTAAGVYTVTLQVKDQYGIASTQTFQYVSVYTPTNQGVFSAGQQFTSSEGDYPQNPALTGPVKFGLVYKYNGGVPVGDKQFMMTFSAAHLTFNATTITALVISNGTATLTGTGTINGSGTYNFAVVGVNNADIRIQITDPSNNNSVIYDTQPGASLTDIPTTPVTGQVIVN